MYTNLSTKKAFDYITAEIHSGRWQSGMRIDTESQLCQKLQVSRAAVRQAIEKLSMATVLIKKQGSGTYVNEFDKCQLEGLVYYPPTTRTMITVLEFRRMFDPYNTQLFISQRSQEELLALETNYQAMRDSIHDMERFRSLDNDFHHIIAKGTHNVIIAQISAMLIDLLASYQLVLYHSEGPDHAIKYHGMILESIREGNRELAYAYSKTHIDNAINRIKEQ